MPFTIITAPSNLPVSVEDVKDHCVIEHYEDDVLITQYIKAVVAQGQNITGRQFVETTYEFDLDAFPSGDINLKADLNSVTSVIYTDTDGNEQTLSTDEYIVKTTPMVGYITPVDAWPSDVYDPAGLKIRFISGWEFTDGIATTPDPIKVWIMVKVAGLYLQRENFVLSKSGNFGIATMPHDFIDALLDEYVVPGIGSGV